MDFVVFARDSCPLKLTLLTQRTQVMQNVACATQGCQNPVIGQCAGYKKKCGKFFCAEHTTDSLCRECAEQKEYDTLVTKVYNDYVNAAERVPRFGCGSSIGILILSTIVMLIFIGIDGFNDIGIFSLIGFVLGPAIFWGISSSIDASEKKAVQENEKTRPGFSEFYKKWKAQRSTDELRMVTILTLAAAGTAASGHQKAREQAAIG